MSSLTTFLALGATLATLDGDFDGDGTTDRAVVNEAGHLVVTGSDGHAWGELRGPSPPRGPVTIAAVRTGKTLFLHARGTTDRKGRRVELVGRVDRGRLEAIYGGTTGPQGDDGEWAERLRVDGEGVVRYQTVTEIVRCDGFDLLYPELYDPASGRFRPVAIAPPDGESLRALTTLPEQATRPPLGLFRFTAASSQRGDQGRAERLQPPRELDDGRTDTAWVEGMSGFGLGAFAVARSLAPGQEVTGIKLVRPRPSSLTEIGLLVGQRAYRVELPKAQTVWIPLPAPLAVDCLTLMLSDAARDEGETAVSEVGVYTRLDGAGGLGEIARALAAGRPGSEALVRLFEDRGHAAVAALRGAWPSAAGETRRRLLRAAIASGAVEAAELLVHALPTADDIERAWIGEALARPALLARVEPLLSQLAVDRSQPTNVRALSLDLWGRAAQSEPELALLASDFGPEAAVRAARIRLAETLPPATLVPFLVRSLPGSAHADEDVEMLGLAAARSPDGDLRQQAVRALTVEWRRSAEFVRRYRILRALARLPSAEFSTVVAAGTADPNEILRWAAVEAATGMPDTDTLLVRATRDDDPRVRAAALAGLDARRSNESVPAAIRALDGDDWPWVRRAAAELLGHGCPGAAGEALARATAAGAFDVRRAALQSLATCDPARAAPLALRLIGDRQAPPRLRELAAVTASSLHGAAAVVAIVTALEELLSSPPSEDFLELSLLRALGRLADHRGEAVLLRAAASPESDVRAAATSALTHFSSPEARAAVRRAAEDPDPAVRKAANARATAP